MTELFQLYNTQELTNYNGYLSTLQNNTCSTLNVVAVSLLNKVSLMS